MPARVKVRINPNIITGKTVKKFQVLIGKSGIERMILNRISTGNSPVQGKGKYEKYSKSYKNQIKSGRYKGKQIRPVNLKLTGKMLKSLKIRRVANGISIIFTDPKAAFHDFLGAGKSKTIRRMLPGKDEKFYRPIQKKINDAAKAALKAAFKN